MKWKEELIQIIYWLLIIEKNISNNYFTIYMNIRITYLIYTTKLDNLFFMFGKSSKALQFRIKH